MSLGLRMEEVNNKKCDLSKLFEKENLSAEDLVEYYIARANFYCVKALDAVGSEKYLRYRRRELRSDDKWMGFIRW